MNKSKELIAKLEGSHFNTKVKSLEGKGSRHIRLALKASKSMVKSMLDPRSSRPNPANIASENLLKNVVGLIDRAENCLKEVKDSKKPLKKS